MAERKVYKRGGRWWGVIPRVGCEAERRSLRLPASAPETEALARWLELARGQHEVDVSAQTPRLKDGFADYHAHQKRRGRSEATREIDEQKAGHFARVWGESLPLYAITAARVNDYIQEREREGASPRSVQRELIVLRGMLKLALHLGKFGTPLERVMPLGFSPEYVPVTRRLTPPQAKRLIAALPPERRGVVAFILATGARRSEAFAARAGDVDEDEVYIRGTKTDAADDVVPITSLQRPWLDIALRYGPPFAHWTNLRRGLSAACRRAKVPVVTPNDLRRTLGYWLRDGGVEPHFIGKILRHVDSRMAEKVYARGTKRGIREAIEAQLGVVRRSVRRAASNERNRRSQRKRKTA